MKRAEFEHVLRAAAEVVRDELVVIGSQSILAQYPDAPETLLRSLEVDLFPRSHPDRAHEIDAFLGDGSRFHETYDYYAHGVGPETPIAPAGWEERLVPLELPMVGRSNPVIAWCMEVHDLVLAKLAAGRPHNLEFVNDVLRFGLVDVDQLRLGAGLMPRSHQELTRERLARAIARADREKRESDNVTAEF